MYRCGICRAVSQPGQAQRRAIIPYPEGSVIRHPLNAMVTKNLSGQILREVPLCGKCAHLHFEEGVPLPIIARRYGVTIDPRSPCPKSPPPRPAGQPKPRLRPVESDDGYILFDGKWVKPVPLKELQGKKE
jgi:hypothetical protein